MVVWLVRDCGLLRIKLQQNLERVTAPRKPLQPLLTIPHVCALHEHEHTRQEALNKFEKYKFCGIKGVIDGNIYPEGESPLQAGWILCR